MPAPIAELHIEYDGATTITVTRPVTPRRLGAVYRPALVTFMCSPIGLHHLALGFLASEGLIATLADVWQLKVYLDEDRVYMYFPAAGLDGELRMPACAEATGSIDVRLRTRVPARAERRILTSGCGGG
ncbi:MAG: formate dehydrogenase accessory sulfurtransferase FdhD [Kouleothrix sp.]